MTAVRRGIARGPWPVLAALLWWTPSHAQEIRVPPNQQFLLLAKVMQYDRNFTARSPEEFVLAVLYQEELPDSRQLKDEFMDAAEASPVGSVKGVPIRLEAFPLPSAEALAAEMARRGIDALYVPPLRARSPEDVCRSAEEAGVVCVTAVADYVGRGAAVGISEESGRPKILIDLTAARSQGVDFSAQLLRVSRVLGAGL